jgi:DNA polymerase III subunit epsilon
MSGPFEQSLTIVDVETTGLDPSQGDEIIELGFIHLDFDPKSGDVRRIRDVYSGLQQPADAIPQHITDINGITNTIVGGKKFDMARVQRAFSNSHYLVAHNASFDRKFLKLLPGLTIPTTAQWGCSCWNINWKRDYGLPNHKLETVRQHLGIKDDGAHEALFDAYVVARILAYPDLFEQVIASDFETKPTLNPASWISDLLREMRGNSRSIDL